jgi:uracil-DNA glycosylase family 4
MGLAELDAEVAACRRCPRLVEWRERMAVEKVARFRDETYWGRPAPGFGDPDARILVVGLAPAAHGANRTGRVFTGDRSGDFLYAALHDNGLSSSPISRRRDDGLTLTGARISAVVHCAPPANKPTTEERDACLPDLGRELALLPAVRVIVALGGFGWDGVLRALSGLGHEIPRPRPRFGHGAEARVGPYVVLGSFHPSQQNTFTGRLTPAMMTAILAHARDLAGLP